MQIYINGKPREVRPGTTIAQLLVELELDSRSLAVECNQQLVPRGEHADTELSTGNRLEVVTLVGGG